MRVFAASLLLVATAPVALAQQDVLVPRGGEWRYLDDGTDQSSAWTAVGFDDSAWSLGDAQLGYGDGDEVTVIDFGPDPGDKHVTTYFRYEFTVPDPSVLRALELRLLRDDGALVHLNGEEIVRSNMLPGPVAFDTHALQPAARGSESSYFPYYLRTGQLRAGSNVLAVEVHTSTPGTEDLSFDLELTGHRGPSVIRGPYVQMVGEDEATLRFRTVVPTDGRVWYGTSPSALTQSVGSAIPTTDHELRVQGLPTATRIYYAVGDSAGPLAGGDPARRRWTALNSAGWSWSSVMR